MTLVEFNRLTKALTHKDYIDNPGDKHFIERHKLLLQTHRRAELKFRNS